MNGSGTKPLKRGHDVDDDKDQKPPKLPRTRAPKVPPPKVSDEASDDDEKKHPTPAITPDASAFQNGKPGGFVRPPKPPRMQRMKWDAQADRTLLLIVRGRESHNSEYRRISELFPQRPTPKAVQERLQKLRAESRALLNEIGVQMPSTVINPVAPEDQEVDEKDRPMSPAPSEDAEDGEDPGNEVEKPKKRTGWDLAREGVPLEILKQAWDESQRGKAAAESLPTPLGEAS